MVSKTGGNMNIYQHDNDDSVAQAVAQRIVESAASAIAARGVFHCALAGGTTPRRCYEYLRDKDIDWPNVHIWLGDERCLPIGDDERNDRMADEALLNHVPIPSKQVHRIHAEQGAERAAEDYSKELATIDGLDLILFGMGEDGHTCSLFPGNPALSDDRLAIPVFHSPKPPSDRVSLGYTAIHAAHARIMMITGEGKRAIFERIRQGESFPIVIPNSEWHSTL